jgi:PAS domain S-box-containing protein
MEKGMENPPKANMDSDFDVSLDLKDRALAAAAEGITIADARLPDQPIIYANEGFSRLTGYSSEEVVGRNCRFLQSGETDPETVRQIRAAIRGDRACSVEILNYRKDGTPFWNRLSITPVKNEEGVTTHFIGIQSDITARRNAEAALEQANANLEEMNLKMKDDLEAAAMVQQSMLPRSVPEIQGYTFAWTYQPCDELAGDTLNILGLNEQTVALYALDVSGHGVPSALLSATLSHWLSPKPDQDTILELVPEQSSRVPVSPERIAQRLNSLFPMNLEHPQYFTLCYGLLDTVNNEFTYVSAGHPPSVHSDSSGRVEVIEAGGPPVGLIAGSQFQQGRIPLKPGDRLVIYTDGVTEAANPEGEEFGFDRLCDAIRQARELSLETSLEKITGALNHWTVGAEPADDISIVALERTS